ncbi:unnamed protein product [Amoebophrya sp. A120]|nr:unnamed protein product [Amoebophrya sp. A120]|eukprot:GSA120T00002401001.1
MWTGCGNTSDSACRSRRQLVAVLLAVGISCSSAFTAVPVASSSSVDQKRFLQSADETTTNSTITNSVAQSPVVGSSRVSVFDAKQLPQYACYKVPYLFHTRSGHLLAFAEARGPVGNPRSLGNCMDWDVTDVVMRRSTDQGETWGPLVTLLEGLRDWHQVVGNLAPVQDLRTGQLLLPFCRGNVEMWITRSYDEGLSWTEPTRLEPLVARDHAAPNFFWWTWVGFGPPSGLQLQHNSKFAHRILLPGYFSDSPIFDLTGVHFSRAFVLYSDDNGASFQLSVVPNGVFGLLLGKAGNECEATELADGRVLLSVRTVFAHRAHAYSSDGGATWSPLEWVPALPSPLHGCQGSVVLNQPPEALMNDQDRTSHAPAEVYYSGIASRLGRHDLTLWRSADGGQGKLWISSALPKSLNKGPSGYSSLVRTFSGDIGVLYEAADVENSGTVFVPDHCWFQLLYLPDVLPTNVTRLQQAYGYQVGAGTSNSSGNDYPLPSALHSSTHLFHGSDDPARRALPAASSAPFLFSGLWWLILLVDYVVLVLGAFAVTRTPESCCCCLPCCTCVSLSCARSSKTKPDLVQPGIIVATGYATSKEDTAACGGDKTMSGPPPPTAAFQTQEPEQQLDSSSTRTSSSNAISSPAGGAKGDEDENRTNRRHQLLQNHSNSWYQFGCTVLWSVGFTSFFSFWYTGVLLSVLFFHDDPGRWIQQSVGSQLGVLLAIVSCVLDFCGYYSLFAVWTAEKLKLFTSTEESRAAENKPAQAETVSWREFFPFLHHEINTDTTTAGVGQSSRLQQRMIVIAEITALAVLCVVFAEYMAALLPLYVLCILIPTAFHFYPARSKTFLEKMRSCLK